MPNRYPPPEEIFPALKPITPPCSQTQPPKSLKEDARSDLAKRAAWFNDLELAGYHTINGAKILCVFDRYEAALAAMDSGRSVSKGAAVTAGLQSDLFLLFIRADEYNGSPRIGQEIRVDGQLLYAQSSILYDGVLEITLRAGAVR